jgi:hypothetical protein
MLHDVINEAKKAIDEIIPRAGLVTETTLDQFAIPGYQSHGRSPRAFSCLGHSKRFSDQPEGPPAIFHDAFMLSPRTFAPVRVSSHIVTTAASGLALAATNRLAHRRER